VLHSRGFAAALFDRDGTLIEDVPYNGEPALVRPVPGTRETLDRLRSAGLRLGVVSNQSGVARGLLTPDQVRRVNARVEELLGPFDTWQYCPHGPDQGCACRKPAPGMILDAARALAADWILAADPRGARPRVLVARGDSTGDMLLTGPAIRSVAAEASRVTLLCRPRGRDAARLLPGVDELIEWRVPWIDPLPPPVDVVVHPGASVPARACPPERWRGHAAVCPVPGHPCLSNVAADDVIGAVEALMGGTA
jgi:histidinol-phosphate phosphatase family protein